MRKKILQRIAVDEDYIPALVEDGDELYPNGIFVFNITKMIEYIGSHKNEIELESIKVKGYRDGLSDLTESHIDTVDIMIPIILAEIRPGGYNVIDGNHRLEKAYRMGVDDISAYRLTPKQHMPFLTSLKAYHAYVEYWNSKIGSR